MLNSVWLVGRVYDTPSIVSDMSSGYKRNVVHAIIEVEDKFGKNYIKVIARNSMLEVGRDLLHKDNKVAISGFLEAPTIFTYVIAVVVTKIELLEENKKEKGAELNVRRKNNQ